MSNDGIYECTLYLLAIFGSCRIVINLDGETDKRVKEGTLFMYREGQS